MTILVLLNNFLHDFSAAGWLFGTVLLWAILRKEIPAGDGGRTIIYVLETVLLTMKVCIAGVIFFGVFRALAYKNYEWSAAAGESQVTLLVAKHIIFAGIVVLGFVYYTRASRLLRNVRGEKTQ